MAQDRGTYRNTGDGHRGVSARTDRSLYTGAGQPVPRSARLASYQQESSRPISQPAEERTAARRQAPRQQVPEPGSSRQRVPQRPQQGGSQRRGQTRPQGRRAPSRPAAPVQRPNIVVIIFGTIFAVAMAIGAAIGRAFSALFRGGAGRSIFSSRGGRGRIYSGGGYGSVHRGGFGGAGGRAWSASGGTSAVRLPVVLRTSLVGALLLTLASAIFAVTPASMSNAAELKLLDMPVQTTAQLPVSTPQSEWKAGELPYLYQIDPAWASQSYAGGTVAANGCGPTCLAMIYVYLTGNTDMDPADMCAFADEYNFAPTGATEHAFMTDGAAILGITGTAMSPTRSEVEAALAAGEPVVCVVRPGDFTSVGHFIILYGIDENGMVGVHDPNSSYNSAMKWDLNRVLSQAITCWTFSR